MASGKYYDCDSSRWDMTDLGDGRARVTCGDFLMQGSQSPLFMLGGGRGWRFDCVSLIALREAGSVAFALEFVETDLGKVEGEVGMGTVLNLEAPGFVEARIEGRLVDGVTMGGGKGRVRKI